MTALAWAWGLVAGLWVLGWVVDAWVNWRMRDLPEELRR